MTNSKVKLPSKIGEAHGSTDISVMWNRHCMQIFVMSIICLKRVCALLLMK